MGRLFFFLSERLSKAQEEGYEENHLRVTGHEEQKPCELILQRPPAPPSDRHPNTENNDAFKTFHFHPSSPSKRQQTHRKIFLFHFTGISLVDSFVEPDNQMSEQFQKISTRCY